MNSFKALRSFLKKLSLECLEFWNVRLILVWIVSVFFMILFSCLRTSSLRSRYFNIFYLPNLRGIFRTLSNSQEGALGKCWQSILAKSSILDWQGSAYTFDSFLRFQKPEIINANDLNDSQLSCIKSLCPLFFIKVSFLTKW